MTEKRLKNFLSAEECVGRTVTKIIYRPMIPRKSYEDGLLDSVSVAVHFGPNEVAVFAFGQDWSGVYYAGETPGLHGVCIEDEGELADCELSADELELWREDPQ